MNYLAVICETTYYQLHSLPSQDVNVGGYLIKRRQTLVGNNWFVMVYNEPDNPVNNLVYSYIDQVIQDILCHAQNSETRVEDVWVYFHFTKIYPNHNNRCNCQNPRIERTRFTCFEKNLKKRTGAQGKVQVWGFHRIGRIWDILQKLPHYSRSFDDFIRELDEAARGGEFSKYVKGLSILKHHIAHLLLPIDIDLQGLMETEFGEDYWKEVVETWRATEPGKPSKAYETLHQVWILLYDQGQEDSVAKMVKNAADSAIDDSKRGKIEKAWQQVQSLLPKDGSLPAQYQEVEQILHDLGCENKRMSVQQKCQGRTNLFHDWFVKLIEALDDLRDAIEESQREEQEKEGIGDGAT